MALTRKLLAAGNASAGTTATAANTGLDSVVNNAGSSNTFVSDAAIPTGTVVQSTATAGGVSQILREYFDSNTVNMNAALGYLQKTPPPTGGNVTIFSSRTCTALAGGVMTGGVRGYSFQWTASNSLALYDATNVITVIAAAGKLSADTWYYWSIREVCHASAGQVRVKVYALSDTTLSTPLALVNSTDANHPTTTEFVITNANTMGTGTAGFGGFDLNTLGGIASARVVNVQYDDGGTTEIAPYVAANANPTVNAGTDQSKNPNDTVALAAIASDPDGNPLTYTWSYLYSSMTTPPALTNANTANPSFTAPSTEGHRFILQCQVSDGLGGVASDTVTINVPISGAFTTLPGAGSNGAWTNTGGAATGGAALADSSDTTLVRSPAYGVSESETRWALQPLKPRTGLQITVRSKVSATGGVTKWRLYSGTTMLEEFTLTQNTSPHDDVLTSTVLPTAGQWEDLYVAAVVLL